MGRNRPWHIWWDFRWEDHKLKWVVVQTDHPRYDHVDYIYRFPIESCVDKNGRIDSWEKSWFLKFRDDLKSGRQNISEVMKSVGCTKR